MKKILAVLATATAISAQSLVLLILFMIIVPAGEE
jgi:hypothetical protein